MTRHNKQKSTGKRLRSLYLWHRWIGMAAAVFVFLLALTGLALNHTDQLQLDASFVQSPAFLDWYGIHAPDDITSYQAGPLLISAIGRQVYSNTTRLQNVDTPLVGAVDLGSLIVVAAAGDLLLLTRSGELLERLGSAAGVPAGMQALGITPDNLLAIHAAHGYYRTGSDFATWHESDELDATWANAFAPPQKLVTILQDEYRGSGLPLERIMLDIHSGRILGEWGVYLMDGAAIVFILLAVSGIWLWGKRRASARAHRRRVKANNDNIG